MTRRSIGTSSGGGNQVDVVVPLLLSPTDNVVVVHTELHAGQQVLIDGTNYVVDRKVRVGFKLARRAIGIGKKVVKFGAIIGSATQDIAAGSVVHLHNMKSDYLPTYSRDRRQFTIGGEE